MLSALLCLGEGSTDDLRLASLKERYAPSVRATGWAWTENRTSILHSLSQTTSPYDILLMRPRDRPAALHIKFMEGERQIHAWWGHHHSVFIVKDRRLYYAEFDPGAPGGHVVAVDLQTGKVIWRSRLKGVGQPPRSIPGNLIDMTLSSDGQVLCVFGSESTGRYYELKDVETGETVGHKVFPAPKHEQSKPANRE
jgi:PQQ enzyme repeat